MPPRIASLFAAVVSCCRKLSRHLRDASVALWQDQSQAVHGAWDRISRVMVPHAFRQLKEREAYIAELFAVICNLAKERNELWRAAQPNLSLQKGLPDRASLRTGPTGNRWRGVSAHKEMPMAPPDRHELFASAEECPAPEEFAKYLRRRVEFLRRLGESLASSN